MNKYSVKHLLKELCVIDTIVEVEGWVRSRRDSKSGVSFIALSDGSCVDTLQIVASTDLSNYATDIIKLTKDCAIKVSGKIVKSLGDKQSVEIVAQQIEVLGYVDNPESYPVAPKRHTVEYLREVAHLRVRTNLIAAVTRVRNTVSYAIHQYLQQNGFYWVHTPIITSSDCEGAGELFRVTTLDLNNIPRDSLGNIDYKQDFFAKDTYLTVSGQLNAEAYCMAMSKVYTFAPAFRAENSNTTRHLAEFWMIEPEIAFANLTDSAALAKNLLKYVFKTALEQNSDDMDFFNSFVDKNVLARLQRVIDEDFATMTYTEAIDRLMKTNKKFENLVSWGIDLSSEHERYLCEELVGGPTIVTDYPKDIKAFYMRQNDDGKTVAAMDILVPGLGEIVGGSQREERYDFLLKRMREMRLDDKHLYWYLDLRRFGSVCHAGFGLGLERLVSYITGVNNIRDVIAFPRSSKSANF